MKFQLSKKLEIDIELEKHETGMVFGFLGLIVSCGSILAAFSLPNTKIDKP